MMKDKTYEALEQLINAYFHQDWSDEHDDEAAVLADFARTTWRDEVQLTILQIDRYLAEHPVGLLKSFESDFKPMITIGLSDDEARIWLESARAHLAQELPVSPVRNDQRAP